MDILSSELLTHLLLMWMMFCTDTIVLRKLLDEHAPLKPHSVSQRLRQPWITDGILEAKRKWCKWEKRSRAKKSGATRIRQEFKESCELVKNMISTAKADYYVNIMNDCCGDQKKRFQVVDKSLGCEKKIVLSDYIDTKSMAQIFNEYFATKNC